MLVLRRSRLSLAPAFRTTWFHPVSTTLSVLRRDTVESAPTYRETGFGRQFLQRNRDLGRPLSPVSIHKLQSNMVLSFGHRFTGMVLSGVLYGLEMSSPFQSYYLLHNEHKTLYACVVCLLQIDKVCTAKSFSDSYSFWSL